ncbi:MAG: response regulator [Myxococcales bacterium]|nr:response regulator [Myxococcota bacterium]MDW8280789.1 response regulator [Myxococcales bacterium]
MRVLIVDDERGVLSTLRRALGRHGFETLLCESGAEALEQLAALSPESLPQVVLSDNRMPGMDGVTLLSHIRARWPTIQRVLITAYADLDALERAINEAGIYRFLNKPWEHVNLLGTVRSAIEQWEAVEENRRLLQALEDYNRRLEEAVAVRTQQLREEQRLWEQTFDAIADPLMVIDEDDRIQRSNWALRSHLGLEQDPVGQRCHELRASSRFALPRSQAGPCAGCPAAHTRSTGEPAEAELTGEAGTLVVRTFWLGRLTVCAYRDVTREREAARQLALADRLAAIGQLAGGVAHEINNPLSGVLAISQLILRDLQTGTLDMVELKELLREIESASLRCKRIVDHLLRFSRQAQRDEVRPVGLNALVQEALPLLEHQYALRGVRIVCTLDPHLPDVLGSPAQLMQVLLTLLSNAFDATQQQRRDGEIQILTQAADGKVMLRVRDQGTGIDERSLPQLFLPFFSTKPEGRGTGLGLAVSYGIVTDHGGKLEVHNLAGGGAEFVVTLPALVEG